MNLRTIAEQSILWYQAFLKAGKGEYEAEKLAVQEVEERYKDFAVISAHLAQEGLEKGGVL